MKNVIINSVVVVMCLIVLALPSLFPNILLSPIFAIEYLVLCVFIVVFGSSYFILNLVKYLNESKRI